MCDLDTTFSIYASVDLAAPDDRYNFIRMMRDLGANPISTYGTVITIRESGPRDKIMELASICYDYPAHTVCVNKGRL